MNHIALKLTGKYKKIIIIIIIIIIMHCCSTGI